MAPYPAHTTAPLDPILRQMQTGHNLKPYFFKPYFDAVIKWEVYDHT